MRGKVNKRKRTTKIRVKSNNWKTIETKYIEKVNTFDNPLARQGWGKTGRWHKSLISE
jgi:hypothetical protein